MRRLLGKGIWQEYKGEGGRKIEGSCIGTTLLTKGLEADTVILIKPSALFKDINGLKHLYVALTRAINKIILIDF